VVTESLLSPRATALVMSAKELRRNARGLQAVCGKCLTSSAAVDAVDPDAAWATLVALGWSTNVEGWPYPVCPPCTANPRTIDEIARGVQKRRKRK
jgi:hypothetical protein